MGAWWCQLPEFSPRGAAEFLPPGANSLEGIMVLDRAAAGMAPRTHGPLPGGMQVGALPPPRVAAPASCPVRPSHRHSPPLGGLLQSASTPISVCRQARSRAVSSSTRRASAQLASYNVLVRSPAGTAGRGEALFPTNTVPLLHGPPQLGTPGACPGHSPYPGPHISLDTHSGLPAPPRGAQSGEHILKYQDQKDKEMPSAPAGMAVTETRQVSGQWGSWHPHAWWGSGGVPPSWKTGWWFLRWTNSNH